MAMFVGLMFVFTSCSLELETPSTTIFNPFFDDSGLIASIAPASLKADIYFEHGRAVGVYYDNRYYDSYDYDDENEMINVVREDDNGTVVKTYTFDFRQGIATVIDFRNSSERAVSFGSDKVAAYAKIFENRLIDLTDGWINGPVNNDCASNCICQFGSDNSTCNLAANKNQCSNTKCTYKEKETACVWREAFLVCL
jgi:hypothetical protein